MNEKWAARAKKLIKTGIGRAAGLTGAYARHFQSKMIIVAFHRVNEHLPSDGITCDVQTFERFCRFFRRYFKVVPLAEQVAGCRTGIDMGGTLSITFDDGYRDNYDVAAPILRSWELPATFFVTTGFIGSDIAPPWDTHLPVQPGWMTWDHLRDLVAQGFDIGCHTDTHIDMGCSDEQAMRTELIISKRKLEEALSRPIELFAYPFGGRQHIRESALKLVQESGFTCCVSCCGGINDARANPYSLNRIAIADWFATPDQFGLELLMGRV